MNIYITLDYELFFGPESGSPEQCILIPTEELLEILEPYQVKMTVFVDSGYLVALKRQQSDYPKLEEDYQKVSHQIRRLSEKGHGIGLHIHPHWEDSYFDGERWNFNTTRYKLADFSKEEVLSIVSRYNEILTEISGRPAEVYRAGGWSAQPFENIGIALRENNIFKDSTVFPAGYYDSNNQAYDFTNVAPYTSYYNFSNDLTAEDSEGDFSEYPISSYNISPLFYWRFALTKILRQKQHQPIGDGYAIPLKKESLLQLLTRKTWGIVSMDGYKATYLWKAFKAYDKKSSPGDNFVIIGHPKAFTPYSLKVFRSFLERTYKTNQYRSF